jgi:hypothetical protein
MAFIDEQYIKENSPITNNVDSKQLYPHVVDAELINLSQILGDEFYKHLIYKYENNTTTADEDELIDEYIKPAVLWRSIWLAVPFLYNDIRNKGFIVNTDDNGAQSSASEVNYLRKVIGDRAGYKESLLNKYLCKNREKFPQFRQQEGLVKPNNRDTNDYGIVFY